MVFGYQLIENQERIMRHECYFCHIRTIEKLIEKFRPVEGVAENFIFSVHELLSDNRETANPKLVTEIHRIAKLHPIVAKV